MKKHFCIVAVLIAVSVILSACNNGVSHTSQQLQQYLSQIYEISDSTYAESETYKIYNHDFSLFTEPQRTYNNDVSKSASIDLAGQAIPLSYVESLYYPLRSRFVHEYSSDTQSDTLVYLNEDGSLYGAKGAITKLDIQKNDSKETVRTALELALSDLVDFSRYQFTYCMRSTPESSSTFGLYIFMYYNMSDGYQTDYLKVGVRSNGDVGFIWIVDVLVNSTEETGNISKVLEAELITAKLNAIYNTDETEYRGHEHRSDPSLVVYNNELYASYFLECDVYFKKSDRVRGEICYLIIPVSLLTNTEIASQIK